MSDAARRPRDSAPERSRQEAAHAEPHAPVRGVIVAHSDLAAALVAAVDRIAGPDEGVLQAVSNEGLGPHGLRARLDELVAEGPVVVFTDLREGSCGQVARQVCLGNGQRALVTGVNLPMLLDFVMKRHLSLAELVPRLVERARSAVTGSAGE